MAQGDGAAVHIAPNGLTSMVALDAHNTTGVSKRELRERYRHGDRIIATLPDGIDCEDAAGVALDGLWGE